MHEPEAVRNDGVLATVEGEVAEIDSRLREGRFQRWLALVAGGSALLGGADVAYEHYRGSYSRRVMYTPVILSAAVAGGGIAGFFNRTAATRVLPVICVLTFADCVVGFYFHVRGVARKPGGWRLPVTNVVMGPPVFAPLLLGVSAYLGYLASLLRRADDDAGGSVLPRPAHDAHWANVLVREYERIGDAQDVREGRFQQQLIVATIVAAGLSGSEAWYSHYKNDFRYRVQWTPVIVAPMLMLSGAAALRSVRAAHTWLPVVATLALLDGTVGFGYHLRGVARRPGGMKKLFYNVVYGPPVFAPLLFAASGFLGVLASILRKSSR